MIYRWSPMKNLSLIKKRSLSSFTLASIHDVLKSEQKPAWSGNKEIQVKRRNDREENGIGEIILFKKLLGNFLQVNHLIILITLETFRYFVIMYLMLL